MHGICVMSMRQGHVVTEPTHYQLAPGDTRIGDPISCPRLYARKVRLDKRDACFQLRRTRKLETHMSAPLLSFFSSSRHAH